MYVATSSPSSVRHRFVLPSSVPAPVPGAKQPPEYFYLNFCSEITEKSINALMGACAEIVAKKLARGIYILFSSGGGSLEHGITLYNFLRALPCKLVMHGIAWNINSPTAISHTQVEEIKSSFVHSENRFAAIVCGSAPLRRAVPFPARQHVTRRAESLLAAVYFRGRHRRERGSP